MSFPILQTPRLILRLPEEQDLDGWADFMADPEASRFVGGPLPRAVAWRGMATMAGSWVLRGYGMFSVVERSTGHWIGRVGPWQPEEWPGQEVAWGLARDAWGRGYAYEAARRAMDWAFEELGWPEVIHTINPENVASIALARKLGSVNRGPGRMPPPYEDHPVDIWGQTAARWRAAREA